MAATLAAAVVLARAAVGIAAVSTVCRAAEAPAPLDGAPSMLAATLDALLVAGAAACGAARTD